jgi:ATP-dependent Clp protease protease subunit
MKPSRNSLLRERATLLFENNIDLEGRVIWLRSKIEGDSDEMEVTSPVATCFQQGIYLLNQSSSSKSIRLILNTPNGGNISQGFAIYDTIKGSKAPVDIEGFGEIASTGSVILQAGRRRLLHSNTTLMIHGIQSSIKGTMSQKDLRSTADSAKSGNDIMYSMFSNRSGNPIEYWEALCENDTYFSAQEAIDAGLADEIITRNFYS